MILVMHMPNTKFYLVDVTKPSQTLSQLYLLKFSDYKEDKDLLAVNNTIPFIELDLQLLFKSMYHFSDMYKKKIINIDFIFQECDTLYDIAALSSKLGRLNKHIQSYNITTIGEII